MDVEVLVKNYRERLLKRRVEMLERARVDMISNQADKQKIWEVMKSCSRYPSLSVLTPYITYKWRHLVFSRHTPIFVKMGEVNF